MKFLITTATLIPLAAALLLSGCAASSYTYYDSCSQSSFVDMVECGKKKRLAACQSNLNHCSREGNAFMQYADALAVGVQRQEISESEARQRLIKFKTQLILAEDSEDAMIGAALAGGTMANRPRQCFRNGPYVNCY